MARWRRWLIPVVGGWCALTLASCLHYDTDPLKGTGIVLPADPTPAPAEEPTQIFAIEAPPQPPPATVLEEPPPLFTRFSHLRATDDFLSVHEQPHATFGLDVDRQALATLRKRLLQDKQLPAPESVCIEGMINAIPFEFPSGRGSLVVLGEVAECPWDPDHFLVCVGIQPHINFKAVFPQQILIDDVRIAWNDRQVARHRLIGYQGPLHVDPTSPRPVALKRDETVIAFFEVVPTTKRSAAPGHPAFPLAPTRDSGELLTLYATYRTSSNGDAVPVCQPIDARPRAFDEASPDFRHAALLAAFGLLLRDSPHRGDMNYERLRLLVEDLRTSVGHLPDLNVFLSLIDAARQLK